MLGHWGRNRLDPCQWPPRDEGAVDQQERCCGEPNNMARTLRMPRAQVLTPGEEDPRQQKRAETTRAGWSTVPSRTQSLGVDRRASAPLLPSSSIDTPRRSAPPSSEPRYRPRTKASAGKPTKTTIVLGRKATRQRAEHCYRCDRQNDQIGDRYRLTAAGQLDERDRYQHRKGRIAERRDDAAVHRVGPELCRHGVLTERRDQVGAYGSCPWSRRLAAPARRRPHRCCNRRSDGARTPTTRQAPAGRARAANGQPVQRRPRCSRSRSRTPGQRRAEQRHRCDP